jgi:hypothetical protein
MKLNISFMKRKVVLLGAFLGNVKVNFRLLQTKSLAFGKAALGRCDSASATPAQPLTRAELLHLIERMMDPAAIAE